VKGTATNAPVRDFREEAFDEVQPRSACWGEVQVISGTSLKPVADGFVRVRPVFIHQESEKLLMAMAGQTLGNHIAVDEVQCRQQRRCPMPFVIMRLAFRHARPQGQRRLRTIERRYLAFLIHT